MELLKQIILLSHVTSLEVLDWMGSDHFPVRFNSGKVSCGDDVGESGGFRIMCPFSEFNIKKYKENVELRMSQSSEENKSLSLVLFDSAIKANLILVNRVKQKNSFNHRGWHDLEYFSQRQNILDLNFMVDPVCVYGDVESEHCKMLLSEITLDELELAIDKLKMNKAAGFDGVVNEMIESAPPVFKTVVRLQFNKALSSLRIPSD
ncbi:hypothetical protein CHUAL_001638 [Chamberlinius hualienensis]